MFLSHPKAILRNEMISKLFDAAWKVAEMGG